MNVNVKTRYEKGPITYGYNGSRWEFQVSDFKFVTPCPGGRNTAEKVVKVIEASIKRTKTYVEPLDQLGRWTIGRIVNAQENQD